VAHTLNVDIFPSTNPKVLIVADTSIWDCDTPIDNLILEVKPPGRGYFTKIAVEKDFLLRLNCVSLGMCCSDCTDCVENYTALIDGVYKIRYSYNPNEKTMAEFRHLRNVEQMNAYIKAICALNDARHKISRKDYLEKEKDLFRLKNYIYMAKYQVEECGNSDEGMELYEQVQDMLEKFIKKCSC
jgi:hypothetical protein